MNTLSDLFALSDAYCIAVGRAEATVSYRVFKGSRRIRDLRDRKSDIGVRRLAEAVQWFSDNWPGDTAWPAGVERPHAASVAA